MITEDNVVAEIRAKLRHLDLMNNRDKFVEVKACPRCNYEQLSVVVTAEHYSELCTSTLNPSCGYAHQVDRHTGDTTML